MPGGLTSGFFELVIIFSWLVHQLVFINYGLSNCFELSLSYNSIVSIRYFQRLSCFLVGLGKRGNHLLS